MRLRKQLAIANWKMNGDKALVENFSKAFNEINAGCEVVFCPPLTLLSRFSDELGTDHVIKLGAQNVSQFSSGAFTGETSVEMLKEVSSEYVIVGHSERRAIFGETNEVVAAKVKAVVDASLVAVLCVGETLEERETDQTFSIIAEQLHPVYETLSASDWERVVVAYEPVWAIGTGKTASPQQAQDVHVFIRQAIKEKLGDTISSKLSILYGGSVNAGNSAELFAQADVDGGLVGGASLKVEDFKQICLSFPAE
jgi:triosephosphate isomerase